jgi:hypothetical protein
MSPISHAAAIAKLDPFQNPPKDPHANVRAAIAQAKAWNALGDPNTAARWIDRAERWLKAVTVR